MRAPPPRLPHCGVYIPSSDLARVPWRLLQDSRCHLPGVFACLVSGIPVLAADLQGTLLGGRHKNPLLKYCPPFVCCLCCWPVSCLHLASPRQSSHEKASNKSRLCFRQNQQNSTYPQTRCFRPALFCLSDPCLRASGPLSVLPFGQFLCEP